MKIKSSMLAAFGIAYGFLSCAYASDDALAKQIELESRRQARSVHLFYYLPEKGVQEVQADVTVRKSAHGTYFCALAFDGGYLGMQELSNGYKVAIFSVWDPGDPTDGSANADAVSQEDRTRVLYASDFARVRRFSGEGTGAQAMIGFDWKEDETYSFKVTVEREDENHIAVTGWCQAPGEEPHKIATFSTCSQKFPVIKNVYSFVEDFQRNFKSAKDMRKAEFTNIKAKIDGSSMARCTYAGFSGDRNPVMNIDAGPVSKGFFLQTGGETKNTHVPLWHGVKSVD